MTIGERIKEKRKEKGWSQRELAARMGYSHHSTLARIETGQVDVSQTRIVQFAEVLGVSIAYLMGWVEEETQKKNDTLSDIILKMNEDMELLSMVETLANLGFEQRQAVKPVLNALAKADK
jgi:repressor LexA